MSSVKFTNAMLEKFHSSLNPEGKRRTIWDSEARGLGAYQTKNGICTLFAHYRLANLTTPPRGKPSVTEVSDRPLPAISHHCPSKGR